MDTNTNLAGVSSQNSAKINTESIFTPKSDEDLKMEEKGRKRELVISAIGDGITALSNLFFTTKGAPSQIQTNGKNVWKPMTSRLQEKFKLEDQEYQNAFANWQKIQKKEQDEEQKLNEKNRKFKLNDNYSIGYDNWEDADYVNQLFDLLMDTNSDENLVKTIDSFHYEYEPIWQWMGDNWAYVPGHDKKIDKFKGRSGTYLKRDLIETIFGDGLTDADNLRRIGEAFIEFDNNWVKLK